jgi:hypothetical protein
VVVPMPVWAKTVYETNKKSNICLIKLVFR